MMNIPEANDATVAEPEIAVIGAGPAGLAVALAIAAKGRDVTLFGPELNAAAKPSRAHDARTTAVLGDSITFLENIGVWNELRPLSAAMATIRIIDDRGGWLKAPEVAFHAKEIGQPAFGYNIPNDALRSALLSRAAASPRVMLVETTGVTDVLPSGTAVRLTTAERGIYNYKLAIAADGRRSIARAAAGISERTWHYPQTAIATSFNHSKPHNACSNELHRRAGPLTTVPLPNGSNGQSRSSLVWVEEPSEAKRLMALSDDEFIATLSGHLQGVLGTLSNLDSRGAFALSGLMATVAGKGRIALAGEALHVVPPIGAQGLNLGFRDAGTIADAIAVARDPGAPSVIETYSRARAADLVTREIGIDLLNRALLLDFPPFQAARGLGLHALANSRALRRAAMHAGMSPPSRLPTLMLPLAKAG